MTGQVLVFGATGGIGEALARRLAARGARPFLVARGAARLAALAAELGAGHAVADVTDRAQVAAAVAAAGTPLAGLAFCVGSIVLKPLSRITEADLLEAFRLNAAAPALAVQAAAPALAAGQGSVVLFSSVAARKGFANHVAIGAAKAAVEGLAVSLAAELAPKVRVNCIAPSLTRTALAEPLTKSPQMAEAIAKQHPIPRLGEGDDSAALADFLLSDAAGWMTGQVIGVDGGRAALAGRG
ncbi:SDR family oxidoreductase [Falsiroseomonas ponticola]|jgi:NAD(P)-dependent dehydrogenase (short-subunit alcohol dehydrogenase family)|uniref:SDR family oxidoreductase n=1 Tax=Falsiroseomonas ponticola TaxID=2786951 RepID=UPI001932937B|nr:SDR family NAD(P)-dependent oxidoreductase [Roseomonas ponticola]